MNYEMDQNPLTQMALAVMATNVLWFACVSWTLYAWGYPNLNAADADSD